MEAIFKILPAREIVPVFHVGVLNTKDLLVLVSAFSALTHRIIALDEHVDAVDFQAIANVVLDSRDHDISTHSDTLISDICPEFPTLEEEFGSYRSSFPTTSLISLNDIQEHSSSPSDILISGICSEILRLEEEDFSTDPTPNNILEPTPSHENTISPSDILISEIFRLEEEDFSVEPTQIYNADSPQVGGGMVGDTSYYSVIRENRSFLRKFRLWGREINISIHPIPSGINPLGWYEELFHSLLNRLKTGLNGSTRGGVTIRNELHPNRDIHIFFRRCDQLEPDVILKRIEKIIQSNKDIFLDGLMNISFQHVDIPLGRAPPRLPGFTDFHSYCKRPTSILVINNEDNLCLPSAICVGMSKHEVAVQDFRRLYKNKHLLRERALVLCRRAGVEIGAEGAGVQEIAIFHCAIPNYHITVFTDFKGRDVIYEGPRYTAGGEKQKLSSPSRG
ncbi:hypothetical protein J437_LFUL008104 [Ladona fulva]|uniref:Uncharacterized protein n=1 Tax=Ladona fulva TaxID=123851 RepID=A0A8K0K124_LADFU|nr:hypothetical protein J437_LFUL008104 [Ladona fulva]